MKETYILSRIFKNKNTSNTLYKNYKKINSQCQNIINQIPDIRVDKINKIENKIKNKSYFNQINYIRLINNIFNNIY